MTKKRLIYLDTAAATPIDRRVLVAMRIFFRRHFGNPSSLHQLGQEAGRALMTARQEIAAQLGAQPSEIIFTSGGTESNNLALQSFRRSEIICTNIEHDSVRKLAQAKILVNRDGLIEPEQISRLLSPALKLVSVIYGSNEIGTIQPLSAVAQVIKGYRRKHNLPTPYLHSDACQVPRFFDLNVEKLGVDLLTLNGSKIYGPKGIGCLYIRRGVPIKPLLLGGGQENGWRSGTENVAAIAGLAKALEICRQERMSETKRLKKLRDFFWQELKKNFPFARLNGHPQQRLPHHLSVTFPGIDGEYLLLALDRAGIAVSLGSACQTRAADPSHAIIALTGSRRAASETLRFTFDRITTTADLNYVLKILKKYAPSA